MSSKIEQAEIRKAIKLLREQCALLKSHDDYTGGLDTTIDQADAGIIAALNILNKIVDSTPQETN